MDDSKISSIVENLNENPNNRDAGAIHDREFLTHQNHRNDGRAGRWRGQISESLEELIDVENRDWLSRMGYV